MIKILIKSMPAQKHIDLLQNSLKAKLKGALLILSLCSLLLLAGCSKFRLGGNPEPWLPSQSGMVVQRDVLQASYVAADRIVDILRHRNYDRDSVILSATFVDINDLSRSTPFGRILSEHISSRLSQHGYQVKELKLRQNSIFIKKGEGEFVLSREIADISNENDANAILAGTYAVSKYSIFVSVRVIRSEDSILIASYDFQIELNGNVKSLL